MGITVHEINSEIDKGPIVRQLQISYQETWSFRDLYNLYRSETNVLLQEIVKELSSGKSITSNAQPEVKRKSHTKAESKPLIERLRKGWDTPILTARLDLADEVQKYVRDF
jgi:methionyl-tRNA formyltransferase